MTRQQRAGLEYAIACLARREGLPDIALHAPGHYYLPDAWEGYHEAIILMDVQHLTRQGKRKARRVVDVRCALYLRAVLREARS
jgi:hypothetical protein